MCDDLECDICGCSLAFIAFYGIEPKGVTFFNLESLRRVQSLDSSLRITEDDDKMIQFEILCDGLC